MNMEFIPQLASGGIRLATLRRIEVDGSVHLAAEDGSEERASVLASVDAGSLAEALTAGEPVLVVRPVGSPPVVLGAVCSHAPAAGASARLDGDRVVLRGRREVVLQCGDASVTLTASGKVLVKGAQVVSHATGVNRIRGGSVQIN